MKKIISTALLSIACMTANSAVIFSDNFDSEIPDQQVYSGSDTNYNSFTNWTVSEGTVDLVAHGDWGLQCAGGSGKCVDLDGSSNNAGIFSSSIFDLSVGSYLLSFDISGNQRNHANDTMMIQLGGFVSDTISRSAGSAWTTVNYAFNVTADSTDFISFNHLGGDNIGIMLDNVSVTSTASVDEPATIALFGLGLVGLLAARRRS